MQKIIVPKMKCPLNILAKLGQDTENALIFFHKSCRAWFENQADTAKRVSADTIIYSCFATAIKFEITKVSDEWYEALFIQADNIAFKTSPLIPKEIYYLQMEE